MAKVQQLSPAQQKQLQNQQAMQANIQARQIVLNESYPITQQVESRTFDPKNQSVFDVTPANIGIIKGFIIKVNAKIKALTADDGSYQLSRFGLANLLRRVTYYDPDNQRHTETTGWHLHFVNSIKQGRPFLATTKYQKYGGQDSIMPYPVPYANTYQVQDGPILIAASTPDSDLNISFMYYVPLAYSDNDLTGAVLANVPQSKQRLRLEFANNNTAFSQSGSSDSDSIYKGIGNNTTTPTFEEMSYTVYQCYLDQLPVGQNGYILPLIDLSTLYCLENTAMSGLTANVDFQVQYANLYKYLSTFAVFENGDVSHALNGDDVNYLSQRTANFSDTRKLDPITWAANTRRQFGSDFPSSVYYCDNRDKPIYTLQYGNVSFVINPKTVDSSNSRLLLGYEYFTSRTELINAGTIATN